MNNGFDSQDLMNLTKDLEKVAKWVPDEEKQFLKDEGTKLRRATKKQIRNFRLGEKTGNYRNSIRRGKVYKYHGAQAIRVYSSAPHAHLLEEGHRMVTHEGREVGFVPGYHIFELARKGFEPELVRDVEGWLEGGLDPLER